MGVLNRKRKEVSLNQLPLLPCSAACSAPWPPVLEDAVSHSSAVDIGPHFAGAQPAPAAPEALLLLAPAPEGRQAGGGGGGGGCGVASLGPELPPGLAAVCLALLLGLAAAVGQGGWVRCGRSGEGGAH